MTATQTSSPRDPKAPLPFSLLAEIAGWYGMLAILGAYTLATYKVLPAESPVLAVMNLTGGLGVAWTCWRKRTWQAFWLEAIWSAVAIGALVRWALVLSGSQPGLR